MTSVDHPKVTIIVAPREKFSCSLQSLDSIIEHTEQPYELIYIDARSPKKVQDGIAARCRQHGFEHVRLERFMPTNAARNIGIAKAKGDYIVFVENDVVVSAGWLPPLVDCADATDATIVSPLIGEGVPIHTFVHCAGGVCGIQDKEKNGQVDRQIFERIAQQKRRIEDVRPTLARQETGLAEFHCMLVRKAYLDQHGLLDERVMNTREHVDFCIEVANNGGTIWLEPDSLVTYMLGTPLEFSDIGFFMMRWSDRWAQETIDRLREKYDLTPDEFGDAQRMRSVNWRRRSSVVRPLAARLTPNVGGKFARKAVEAGGARVERLAGKVLHFLNDRRTIPSVKSVQQ